MKKTILFILLLTIFGYGIQAQTADEIIDNYLDAIGGKEKLEKLEGLHIKAKAQTQGMEIPAEIYMFNDGKILMKFNFQGKEITQMAFDGNEAWGMNMMNQKPEKLDKEATENIKRNAKDEFPIPFLNYKKKGYKVEFMGKEEIEGTETYKIKLTEHPIMKDGKEVPEISYYYFDTENYVPIVKETPITEGPYQGKKVQEVYSDYQEVNGIYFPFTTTNKFNGMTGQTVKIDSIELNPKLDDSAFKFPENQAKDTKDQGK